MAHDAEKEAAARASLRFVRDRLLGERVPAGLKIRGIPTSRQIGELAATLGIPLTTLNEIQEIDIIVDGAETASSRTVTSRDHPRS